MKRRKSTVAAAPAGGKKPATLDRAVADRLRRGVGVSTAERVRQSGAAALDIRDGVQRIAQAPLDRLHARKALTRRQFEAGDRFREVAYAAGMTERLAQRWEPTSGASGSGPTTPDFMAAGRTDAYRRWTRARQTLGRLLPIVEEVAWHAGPGDRLMDLGARVLGMPASRNSEVAALAVLRVGLDALADHWEM